MLQEMLMAKNEIIEKLTSQIYELENSHGDHLHRVSVTNGEPTTYPNQQKHFELPSAKEVESLKDACKAYELQNKFLSKEILELNELRHYDMTREKMILIDTAKLEGDFLQTRSKYLYLLKELEKPKLGGEESEEAKKQEVINQLLEDALESEKTQRVTDRRQLFLSSQSTQEVDKYGFQKWVYDDDVDLILARAGQLQDESDKLTNKLKEAEEATSHQVKWENFMVGQSGKYLTRSPELKTLIRLGIPHEYREQIWRGCINLYVGETKTKLGPSYYKDLVQKGKSSNSAKQIELDLLRTLPTNVHFESLESDGIKKLRHVLLAYSKHNPDIGYCQGLNRLVAIALLFLTEEESFWCLVAIVDHIMPKDYYTKTLAAAQADQRVLKDLIQEKLPKLYSHFETYDVDLSLFTFNWFLTVFVDNIPPDTFLKVWDSFLYEGSKVMFRFAIAFLKLVEDDILIQSSSLAINRYMRVIGDKLTHSKRISQIAFHDLNPFPMRTVSSRRLHHLQQVRTELAELDIIRQKFSSKAIPEDRKDYYDDEDDDDDEEEIS
ncbi:TBC1 domain family member 2B isoform X1 [Patella vulgata]|uniref:TBC1 domain family member 2B isoform X1 n=1 Tax=Patella vulgata TaxID=6465 RepID=UPI00217F28BA|nr:TBC1 domain family member 2B isoform X1 [Patella vulgata]